MENNRINKRSFSRFFAVQILFAYLFDTNENKNIKDLLSFIEEYYISDEIKDYKQNVSLSFLNELLNGTLEHLDAIDAILEKNIEGKYSFNVLDNLIKVIMRLAMYEFKYTDTDKNVIINEYVDIAGEYFDAKAISFVNATLDKLSKV